LPGSAPAPVALHSSVIIRPASRTHSVCIAHAGFLMVYKIQQIDRQLSDKPLSRSTPRLLVPGTPAPNRPSKTSRQNTRPRHLLSHCNRHISYVDCHAVSHFSTARSPSTITGVQSNRSACRKASSTSRASPLTAG